MVLFQSDFVTCLVRTYEVSIKVRFIALFRIQNHEYALHGVEYAM